MRRSAQWLFPLLLLLGLGCAALEQAAPPKPETPRQAYLVAVREADALVLAATDLRAAGLMPDALHQEAVQAFDRVAEGLRLAGAAFAVGDLATAEAQTRAATLLLLELRAHLAGGAP